MRAPAFAQRRQRGTTLLEALVAFLVLSLGMLTVVRVQTQLRFNSDVARQRSEAVRLGQEDLETLRAFSVLAASAGARAYAEAVSASHQVDSSTGFATNTRYTVARQIDAAGAPHAKNATVTVSWSDRSGDTQQVTLNSVIAGADPAYSGALVVARRKSPSRSSSDPAGNSSRTSTGALVSAVDTTRVTTPVSELVSAVTATMSSPAETSFAKAGSTHALASVTRRATGPVSP